MGRAWGRLQDRSDFLKAAGQGVRQGTPAFLVQAVSPAGSESAAFRIGFTATRKLGNAVIRNRAKRRLRAVADAALTGLTLPPANVVLIARPDALSRAFTHMTEDLLKALSRLLPQLGKAKGTS
ncbi:MAG: ribonuclease P protein component [Rhodospirillaceae bacterium]|nr:ribonuclease P protein component [Rhodospirillaceae bacterium]